MKILGWHVRLPEEHKEPAFFLLIVVVFSFLPIWLTLFAMFMTGRWDNVGDLWSGGALFIYSAALLGSACYTMHGYSKKGVVSLVGIIEIISWLMTMFSAAGFMISIIPGLLSTGAGGVQIGTETMRTTGFVFVFISLLITYYAHYYEYRTLDPERNSQRNTREIMDSLT
jgi:hypothetical protein